MFGQRSVYILGLEGLGQAAAVVLSPRMSLTPLLVVLTDILLEMLDRGIRLDDDEFLRFCVLTCGCGGLDMSMDRLSTSRGLRGDPAEQKGGDDNGESESYNEQNNGHFRIRCPTFFPSQKS